eukprot:CAMPEP_0196771324 /NCGR_PEP_ID=MMETSP1104-20130614/1620_1 /TAXON_ID=33652 /ORGANISM="Cafeteria sp., Strain Caron Lab Isolate" /LENGTH=597 /DNA_ID=CAMNT_0042141443 /DNA_START=233 /DNA_END=2022 /DNA_ORIENTATION=-
MSVEKLKPVPAAESSALLPSTGTAMHVEPKRVVNALSLAFLAYLAVSGGPFGIEDAVSAAGALPTILAILLLPLLWGLPQALMTAELSTMMDENGGYILWVQRGMGPFWGWMNAFNSLCSNLCDLPTYPVLFSSYLQSTWLPHLTGVRAWLVRMVSLAIIYVVNVAGLRSVSFISMLVAVIIILPFLLEPVVAAGDLRPGPWASVAPSIDWSTFVSTVLWNYQGWDSLGCIAGEVKNVGVSYPVGIALAMLLITLTYLFPVGVGVCVDPVLANWDDGYLATLAKRMSPWLGVWVLVASAISNLGEFNVVMSTSSRALWSMARIHMLPSWVGISRSHGVPVAAITLQALVCSALMTFDFTQLVLVDTFFNNLSLLLELASFVRLRYVEPDAPRPYRVPGGTWGLWAITIPKVLVLVGSLVLMDWTAWALCCGANLLFALAYLVWRRHNPAPPNTTRARSQSVLDSPSTAEGAAAAAARAARSLSHDGVQGVARTGGFPAHLFRPRGRRSRTFGDAVHYVDIARHVPPTVPELAAAREDDDVEKQRGAVLAGASGQRYISTGVATTLSLVPNPSDDSRGSRSHIRGAAMGDGVEESKEG